MDHLPRHAALLSAASDGKDNIPVAELVPVTPVSAAPQFGSAKGLLKMSDDFDAPLDDFRAYEA